MLMISITAIVAFGCAGETRKLTKEEKVYKPSDQEKFTRIKKEGGFLTDLFKKGTDKVNDKFVNRGTSSTASQNSLLWKSSLEILSSFPLSSVDANSGIVITDWYSSEKKPSERFKITILILDNEISSNSVKVKVHKQIIKNSRWVNTKFDTKKTLSIERKIIQKAIEKREQGS